MKTFWTILVGAWLALTVTTTAASAVPAAQDARAKAVVQAAAQAMGGADRLAGVRNVTAHGYAQYAYQFGAGRITGEAEAPEKYIAANELTRVYDLEHDRFQAVERRNMLFPFLGAGAHNWGQVNQVLDGAVAFDIQGDRTRRVASMSDGALWLDGVHVRRMWMVTNPLVMVRRMMDPATRLSAPRREGGLSLVDATLETGDKFTAAFKADGRPAWMRWSTRHTNFGQIDLTTHYTGWADATGNSGIKLPLGYVTRLSYRNVDYFKLYVDGYDLNTALPDLAAPQTVRDAPEPPSYVVPPITSVQIGKGIWRIDQGGTMVIEFKDHLVIYELNIDQLIAKAIFEHARKLAPGKPITHYIASHNHLDHIYGIRQAVAEGMTVVQLPEDEAQFRLLAEHPAPDYPDDLARSGRKLKFQAIEGDHLRMADETQAIDIYHVPQNAHMADALVIYIPAEKMLMEGDLVVAAELAHWPDGFRDVIARYRLDVEWVAPVHPNYLKAGEGKFTRAYTEQLLQEMVDRARKHCELRLSQSTRHPGCPIQTKYY